MPRFDNPQVRPFRARLGEPPLELYATAQAGEAPSFACEDPEWAFLVPLLAADANGVDLRPAPPEREDFWRAVLEYGPEDDLDFVTTPGAPRPFPRDVLDDWPDNAAYEHEIWWRKRQAYEVWRARAEACRAALAEPVDWSAAPPDDRALRALDHELGYALPDRISSLRRLHALGVLAPEVEGEGGGEVEPRVARMLELGCGRLAAMREATLLHRLVAPLLDGGLFEGATSCLESPVGLEWFLDGPFQQRHLDPLHHLRFGLHHHLGRAPPEVSSSFVVSMGGRISGAFYYQQGPGGLPQLVRGGEPPPESPVHASYVHGVTPDGDRVAELAGRALRAGRASWGGRLAALYLARDPEHGQCWIELAVALHGRDEPGQARACLERARELGHRFHERGELAPLLEHPPAERRPLTNLVAALGDWRPEFADQPLEELVALALMPRVARDPVLWQAWSPLELPGVLRRRVATPRPAFPSPATLF